MWPSWLPPVFAQSSCTSAGAFYGQCIPFLLPPNFVHFPCCFSLGLNLQSYLASLCRQETACSHLSAAWRVFCVTWPKSLLRDVLPMLRLQRVPRLSQTTQCMRAIRGRQLISPRWKEELEIIHYATTNLCQCKHIPASPTLMLTHEKIHLV